MSEAQVGAGSAVRSAGGTAAENNEAISFTILEHLGVLRASASGWARELNYISWCDRPARFDIRDWTPDHKKSSRGITLTDYEMNKICEWVSRRNSAAASTQDESR
ncbi:MAG: hypothetical protein IJM61_02340 [Firmicutes bacterium]|nr:hypothetical protein [Bacillota bacterium]